MPLLVLVQSICTKLFCHLLSRKVLLECLVADFLVWLLVMDGQLKSPTMRHPLLVEAQLVILLLVRSLIQLTPEVLLDL